MHISPRYMLRLMRSHEHAYPGPSALSRCDVCGVPRLLAGRSRSEVRVRALVHSIVAELAASEGRRSS